MSLLTPQDQLYLNAYAYGYNIAKMPLISGFVSVEELQLMREGYEDGMGDVESAVLPVADFDCGRHLSRNRGTYVTNVYDLIEPRRTRLPGGVLSSFWITGFWVAKQRLEVYVRSNISGAWLHVSKEEYEEKVGQVLGI